MGVGLEVFAALRLGFGTVADASCALSYTEIIGGVADHVEAARSSIPLHSYKARQNKTKINAALCPAASRLCGVHLVPAALAIFLIRVATAARFAIRV